MTGRKEKGIGNYKNFFGRPSPLANNTAVRIQDKVRFDKYLAWEDTAIAHIHDNQSEY